MAKHKQLWLKGSKGKLAGTTFYQTSGVTIQREINYGPGNPRTDKQMTQRTKLANLVNMYRLGKDFFPRAFENKKALESDYNKFVSYNLTNSPIFLTKGEAAKGYFVPAAYQISQGSLQGVGGFSLTGNTLVYNGVAGDSMSANTTVGDFTASLISGFTDVRSGDQLSLVLFRANESWNYFVKVEIILDLESTEKLADVIGENFEWSPTQGIIYDASDETACAGIVLSRTIAGKTLVSNCVLVGNEGDIYDAHTGDTARKAAINSYGASKKVFLDNK